MFVALRFRRVIHLVVVAAFSFALVLAATMSAFASGGGLQQISSDPYTNSTSQHKTEVEPDTYSNGSTIVSAFQAGRFTDGGASNIGWATSTNSGMTWTSGFLPGTTVYATPPGTYARATDAAVTYDVKKHIWMIVVLALNSSGTGVAILVSRSTDGLTWKNPVTAVLAGSNDFFDKTWIVCDNNKTSPFNGHCYIEFDNFNLGDLEMMTTSTDAGRTWSTPQTTGNQATGLGGQPLVQPSGTVIVPFDNAFEGGLQVFTSTNGGTSWSNATTVASFTTHAIAGGIRSPDLISAEIDKSGKVYVVWYDCRFESGCGANDIVMITTTDGVHWSAVTRIPADGVGSGVDHFLMAIAVDRTTFSAKAHLVVTYYYYPNANCSPTTCQLDVGEVSSTNGGTTWGSSQQIGGPMTLSWLAQTNQGVMVGDYFSASFSLHKAYAVIAQATAPSGGTFNENMYATIGLTDAGGNIPASTSGAHVVPGPAHRTVLRAI